MKVAIIGMGTVGQAQQRWLGEHVHVTYDPKYDLDRYPYEHIAACDFAVICVPTPGRDNGTADLTYVEQAVYNLPDSVPVLLRSTVPPGITETLGKNVVFCPEFIQENPAKATWQDPQDVPFLILGGGELLTARFRAWIEDINGRDWQKIYRTSAVNAELAKYVINTYLATKVTFANEMSRICATFGVDWREVEELWRADPRTGPTHTSVILDADGRAGFSGACFPKDLSAIIASASYGEYDPEFLRAVRASNERFRA